MKPGSMQPLASTQESDAMRLQVQAALQQWTGAGTFVFTSSIGVYTQDQGETCSEETATQPRWAAARALDK